MGLRTDLMDFAAKSAINQYIAANRVDATTRDLVRLHATSTSVHACATFRAENVAQVPMIVQYDGEPVADDHPLQRLFRRGASAADLMLRSELSMYYWGHNLVRKQRNAFQVPQSLRWINPSLYDRDIGYGQGLRGFRVYPSSMYQIEWTHYIERRDAIYVHEVDFDDDFGGVSPAEVAFLQGSLDPEIAQTQLATFRNLAIPALLIQPEADATKKPDANDVKKLTDFFRRMVQGAINAGKTVVSPARWDVKQLQGPLKDLEMSAVAGDARLAVCIASRLPLELIVPSAATYAAFEGSRRTWAHAWLVPRVKWYASQFTEQLAVEFGPGYTVVPDFDAVDFLKEDARSRVEVVKAKLDGALISLYSAQKAVGEEPEETFKDLYMIDGVPVPKAELPNLWKLKFAPPSPFGAPLLPVPIGGDPGAVTPANPTPDADKAAAPTGKSLCVMLDLANNPDLVSLQNRVKEYYSGQPVQWNAPDSFHVTLLYAPSATDEQLVAVQAALTGLEVPDLALGVGSLKSFDNLGNHALHFRIRRNVDLLELQETVYDLCQELGLAISSHSLPANYTPHATMGYAPQRPRTVTFGGRVTVTPVALLLASGDDIVWKGALANPLAGKSASRSRCMKCPAAPTKDVLWAEGKARAWFCDQHYVEWSGEHPDVDYVHTIDGEAPPEFGSKSASAAFLPDPVHKELKDWQALVGRKGRDYPFSAKALDRRVSDYIQVALDDGDDLDALFAEARALALAGKAYADTRADFVDEMVRIIGAGQASEVTRQKFGGEMRSALRRYGLLAFRDGLNEGGQDPESLSPAMLKAFRDWQAVTSGYISGLGAEVFRDGITEAEVKQRAELWANKSLNDIRYRALRLAAPQKRYRWDIGRTEKHCHSCLTNNGQVKTMEEWEESGLPRSDKLDCGGWLCDCNLVEVVEEQAAEVA